MGDSADELYNMTNHELSSRAYNHNPTPVVHGTAHHSRCSKVRLPDAVISCIQSAHGVKPGTLRELLSHFMEPIISTDLYRCARYTLYWYILSLYGIVSSMSIK